MHKRKGALANSSALLSLKLCIFFCLFLSFSCPFSVLFNLFTSFLPFLILFYPFSIFFYSFRLLSLLYSAFTIYLSSLSFLLFLAFIILKPFYSPYLSLYIPFYLLFLPCLCSYSLIISFTLVPVLIYLCVFPFILPLSLLMPSMLSGFVFPLLTSIYSYSVVVIILLMCLSLCSLLPECLDALPHVPEVLYHL